MADRFYVNSPLALGAVRIDGAEAHHLAVVCRVRPGDPIVLFNGEGQQFPALVQEVGKREVVVEVTAVELPGRELPFPLVVAAPLPKGDRAQFLVEKLTELGATAFIPLATARSVVQPRDAKLEKLQRHVIEASKQCGRNVLMEVRPLHDWAAFCQGQSLPARRCLAHPGAAPGFARAASAVVVAVGPEGGFTDDEVVLALTAGWEAVSLGPRILRVETAALALTALFALA